MHIGITGLTYRSKDGGRNDRLWADKVRSTARAGTRSSGSTVPLVTGSYFHARECQTDVADVYVEVKLWTRAVEVKPSTVFQYVGERGLLSLDLHPTQVLVVRPGDHEYWNGLELQTRQWTQVALAVGEGWIRRPWPACTSGGTGSSCASMCPSTDLGFGPRRARSIWPTRVT